MFLIDMSWDLNQVYDELDRLPREGWDHFRQNLNFLFEANPQSYKDRVERAAKVVFGDNWKLSPLVGRRFTQEDVRAQQPDTEDYQDPDDLDPTVFPAAPKAASSAAVREDVPPKVKPPPPGLVVQTPTVKLSSAPPMKMPAVAKVHEAAKAAASSIASGSTPSQVPSQASLNQGQKRSYFMDDHLPEYEYTLAVNANGDEVPAINFNGTVYELEVIKAQDVIEMQRACNVDAEFKKYATRVNKVCRGTASCSGVPMDKELFIDLEDFAKAFRKEVPPKVKINVKNLFGTAMEIDRHGKSRFEMLCARIPLCPVNNGLQPEYGDVPLFPVKIKAIQGHSDIALRGAGGLFATAASVMCSPAVAPERQAAFAGVPVLPMSEVPAIAYHRTNRSNWKSIAKNGLIPGGGDSVNSGRAHIYMSEYEYGKDGYRSGLRGKCPVEVKVAVGQAVKAGIIVAKTKMDGLITAERVPSAFLISIYDTEKKQMLWNRADSNIVPSAYEPQDQDPSDAAATSPRPSSVNLVARDDRDLGDDDTSSAHADASTAAEGSNMASRKRESTDPAASQPPSRVRRVVVANTEPFTGDCPVCMTDYVSGQMVCSVCGYEPLPVDETGRVHAQPNRRSRLLERRMNKLQEFGIYGDVNTSLLQAITNAQCKELQKAMGPRGMTSIEANTIRESKDRFKRALAVGYTNVEDRYASDATFCDRVHQEGRGLSDCVKDDFLAFANLPDPPRTFSQVSAGVAANAEYEHRLMKLVYFDHPHGPAGFPVEYQKDFTNVWGFMFGKHLFNEEQYTAYLQTRSAHRDLLTWKGVVKVPYDVARFLEEMYERNLPLAKKSADHKREASRRVQSLPREEAQSRRRRQSQQLRASGCLVFKCRRISWTGSRRKSSKCSNYQSQKGHHLPLLARGDPMLRDPAGAITVITTAPSVNGPNTVDSGGTGTGPAAAGSFGVDFPNSMVWMLHGKLHSPTNAAGDRVLSGLSFLKDHL